MQKQTKNLNDNNNKLINRISISWPSLLTDQLSFRSSLIQDCYSLHKWRNDVKTRENSFNTNLISFEDYKQKFKVNMENPLKDSFILFQFHLRYDDELGTIRFERFIEKNCAEISITIAPEHRRKGFGSRMLKELSYYYLDWFKLDYISAQIKPFNLASVRAFKKAGFKFYKKFPKYFEYRLNKKWKQN